MSWLRPLRAEALRLSTGRLPWTLPLAAALGGAYAAGLGAAAERGLFGAPTGFYLAAATASGAAVTCTAVGALLAASAVGGDFASGVARTALSRPVGRTAWLLSRLAALWAAVALLDLAACTGAAAWGALRFGLFAVAESGYVLATRELLLGQLVVGVAVSVLGTGVAVCLGGLLGALWGRPGPAVVCTVLLGAVLLALGRWPEVEPYLPSSVLTAALDRVSQLAQGLATLHATDVAPRALGVFAAWVAVALAVALPWLERKDVVA
jgi:hypothetical protein